MGYQMLSRIGFIVTAILLLGMLALRDTPYPVLRNVVGGARWP